MPCKTRKQIMLSRSQARPPSQPSVGITTVRAIKYALRTHWIWVTSARRCVIIVGTATLTDPIITALVSEPRIIDRLMAQRAVGLVTPDVSTTPAAPAAAADLSGGRGGLATATLFYSCLVCPSLC